MKIALLLSAVCFLTGCATNNDYQLYVEQTTKIIQASAASEAACLLVVAEGVKSADAATKMAIATQIDRCKKELPKIEAPKKSWLGL